MKLKLNVCSAIYLMYIAKKFQIDVSKLLEKGPEISKNPKHAYKSPKFRKSIFFSKTVTYIEKHTEGCLHVCTKFEGVVLIHKSGDCISVSVKSIAGDRIS